MTRDQQLFNNRLAAHQTALLRLLGVDPAKLTAPEIKTASELVRRISQCECVPGSNQRRPAATEARQAFLAAHPDARSKLPTAADDLS
jgi:hypothetical protein